MDRLKINTIYIISKGRPWCKTAQVLERMNYSGEWYIVCGNNDEKLEEYKKRWRERILVFDWYKEVIQTEFMDNFGYQNIASGASPVRNATREISFKRGELRHWQFDDDYNAFYKKENLRNKKLTGMEFEKELYKIALFGYNGKLANVGFSLGHEAFPDELYTLSKRVFNAHNLPSDKDLFIKWRGRMNDDLINALDVYRLGKREYSFKHLNLVLKSTQAEEGGLTDLYKKEGTVRKTAYAVLANPGAVKLVIKFGRYHHSVDWKKITPKMLDEKYARV